MSMPTGAKSATNVHRIEMGEQFHCSTKLDRDPEFIADLLELCRERATEFFECR